MWNLDEAVLIGTVLPSCSIVAPHPTSVKEKSVLACHINGDFLRFEYRKNR